MKLAKLLTLLILLLPSFAFAAGNQNITEEVRQVTGYGNSQSLAISDALVRAVGQLKGVSISSDTITQQFSSDTTIEKDGDWKQRFATNDSISQLLRTRTKGQLASYEVDSLDQVDNGYEATLTVTYHKFKEQGISSDERRKLAVLPFKTSKKRFSLLGDSTPASKIESEFRNNLIDLFTQSRRLSVLDREFGEEFESEKRIWKSEDADSGESARLGNVRGADYLVVGKIIGLRSSRYVEYLQLTNESISTYSGKVQVSYKLIQAATRQVKWSDTITMTFGNRDIIRMLNKYGSSQTGILHAISEVIVQESLANIYPMQVVSKKGSTVVLNQGGKTLKKGNKLNVFFLGEEMFDPYTKESLGKLEEQVATIKVIRILPKVTYAKIIDGDADLVDVGCIVRRIKK
ncbi:MAG: CsgG/HfaB family protein [Desulfotalea sp.]